MAEEEFETAPNAECAAPWLEVGEGEAPLLLIAPHGGRAGPAAHSTLHPKVNDLRTAEITRILAADLGAPMLINTAMDRNQLDCNRLGQLTKSAPWLLAMLAGRVERMVARHGRLTVLLIHGWNVIEPRVDFGVGLRSAGNWLRPARGAFVSASDGFINGTLAQLSERLRKAGITPSFGLRYPGGSAHNLLQAFTSRHGRSPVEPLRRLAVIAARGVIDAVQLELSVALRWPGAMRSRNLQVLSEVFSRNGNGIAAGPRPNLRTMPMVRPALNPPVGASPPRPGSLPTQAPRAAARFSQRREPAGAPTRIGIEFFDPGAKVGGMASFDFGPGASGGRIMVLHGRRKVSLFSGEDIAEHSGGRIVLGPLSLELGSRGIGLEFRGPAAVVADATAYRSVEHALAIATIDDSMAVSARMLVEGAPIDLKRLTSNFDETEAAGVPVAAFGSLTGKITLGGVARPLNAVARIGLSFTGIGQRTFGARRMVWVCFPGQATHTAFEAGVFSADGGIYHRAARMLAAGESRACEIEQLELDTPAPDAPPQRITALVRTGSDGPSPLIGHVESFILLSRPGPLKSRIHTSLGFASFSLGSRQGAGMFEYSRRSDRMAPADSHSNNDE